MYGQTPRSYCTSIIVYTFIDIQTSKQPDPTVFSITSGNSIIVKTTDPTKVRQYNLLVRAQILPLGRAFEMPFIVTITNKCPSASLISPMVDPKTFTMLVDTTPLQFDFLPWNDNVGGICGEITYTAKYSNDIPLDN